MIREERLVRVGSVFEREPEAVLAVTVTAPEAARLTDPPLAFFCAPGGGLDRGYFDLRAGVGTRFSFAVQMAERGCITIAIDPLGIGGSTRPARGFDLTVDVHARSLARLHDTVCAGLRGGSLLTTLPALPGLLSVGVGHSVGALLVLEQQVAHRRHDALALLGFGTRGLPSALDAELGAYAGDPAGARANVVRLARGRYVDPYPMLELDGRAGEIYGGRADPHALQAMRACRAPLLPTIATFVIIPGSAALEAARVDVPLLLVAGDRDLCGPAQELAADFPRSPSVSVLELANTGHSHFAFPSVDELFPRMAAWACSLLTGGAERRASA